MCIFWFVVIMAQSHTSCTAHWTLNSLHCSMCVCVCVPRCIKQRKWSIRQFITMETEAIFFFLHIFSLRCTHTHIRWNWNGEVCLRLNFEANLEIWLEIFYEFLGWHRYQVTIISNDSISIELIYCVHFFSPSKSNFFLPCNSQVFVE